MADHYCKRYNIDLQRYFLGHQEHEEVDAFFTHLSYWINYYQKAEELIDEVISNYPETKRPPEKLIDDPKMFYDWRTRIIERKREESNRKRR